MTGWKRRSRAGSPRIHLSYSPPVVAPMIRMSPRTRAGFSMLAASIAAPSAVPWPMRLCSSSTNRIRSGSADSSRTSFRMRSSYWPRNVVPASRATWSSATTRTSLSAGGTSPAATRCASPSTIAVFPTPAVPISAGLFLLWRSRMSITRAISASRQHTGSRSPRRACAVRSTPTRSSTSPDSNRPARGSLTGSTAPHELQVPRDDAIPRHEHDGGRHGEEYPERHFVLPHLPEVRQEQGGVDRAPDQRTHEHREEHVFPSQVGADHGHHFHVSPAHGLLFQDPGAHDAHRPEQRQPCRGARHRANEAVRAPRQRQREPQDEAAVVQLIRDDFVPPVDHADAEQHGAEHGRPEALRSRPVGQDARDPQQRHERLDDRILLRD